MDIQNEKLKTSLDIMEQTCTRLNGYQSIIFKKYKNSWEIQSIVERQLQQGIQACMDATMRLITLKNFGHPDEYVGLFDTLA
ncbi:MAG: hypothetical protein QMD71_00970 [bacterium]|nr:hypothetical protein [bacterium]